MSQRRYATHAPRRTGTDELALLARRIGRVHVQQRLGMEADYEARIYSSPKQFYHLENWYSVHALIRTSLRLVGLHGRAQRNARAVRLLENEIQLAGLPAAFDGYTLLQISDPHVDMDPAITRALIERIDEAKYDACVLTGDYRARTFGPHDAVLDAMAGVRAHLKGPMYAVLGNHDTVRMVPRLESMGMQVLMNESVVVERAGAKIYIAGIDDAHYYRLDNIAHAARNIPPDALSVLLSHTPEVYERAAHAGFSLMLCGHTHGGQICLPGGWPLITDADCPRYMAAGAWRYKKLIGYTSVGSGASIVDVRLNCLPEVTLHRLRAI